MQVYSVLVRGSQLSNLSQVAKTLQGFYSHYCIQYLTDSRHGEGLRFAVFLPYDELPHLEKESNNLFSVDGWTLQVSCMEMSRNSLHRESTFVKVRSDTRLKVFFQIKDHAKDVGDKLSFEVTIAYTNTQGNANARPFPLFFRSPYRVRWLGALNQVEMESSQEVRCATEMAPSFPFDQEVMPSWIVLFKCPQIGHWHIINVLFSL